MLSHKDIKQLKNDSKQVMKALQEEALRRRFLVGTHNSNRLKISLAAVDRLDLDGRTLLTTKVHQDHSARLAKRYLELWKKIQSKSKANWLKVSKLDAVKKPSDSEIADQHLRFLTVVDTVTAIDARQAVQAGIKLKDKLTTTVKSTRGVACLGVIEVEVVSLDLMEKFSIIDNPSDSEKRKLAVCKKLAENLKSTLYSSDSSLFLIHFHGLIIAKNESHFSKFESELKKVKQWNLAPRQIMMSKLSTSYGGRDKSVTHNLKDIATYITKGGNDWYGKKAYLRYKIGFVNEDDSVVDEDTWVAKNWRRNELLRKEHSEDGIEDQLSMTADEIGQLAIVIDGLMGLNRTRTGYLVSVR